MTRTAAATTAYAWIVRRIQSTPRHTVLSAGSNTLSTLPGGNTRKGIPDSAESTDRAIIFGEEIDRDV